MYLPFILVCIFTNEEHMEMSYLCNRFWILNVQSLLCVSRHFRDLNNMDNNKIVNRTGIWHSTFDIKMKLRCIDINSFTRYSTVILKFAKQYCLFLQSFFYLDFNGTGTQCQVQPRTLENQALNYILHVCARFFFRHIQYIYINYLPLPVRSAYFIVRRHSRLKI